MKVFRFIWANLDQFRLRFALVFLASMMDGVVIFGIPALLAQFTSGNLTWESFQKYFLAAVGCYVASLFFQRVSRKHGESLNYQFGNYLRVKLFEKYESLPLSKLNQYHSAYVLSLINRVTDILGLICNNITSPLAKSISVLTLFFFFTAAQSWLLAVINLVVLLVFMLLSGYLSSKWVPLSKIHNLKRAALLENYGDLMSNISTVKRLGIKKFAEKKLNERTADNFKAIYDLCSFHANRWFLLHGVFGVAYMGTLGAMIWLAISGRSTIGILVLFVGAFQLIRNYVEVLSEMYRGILESGGYLENLEEIFDCNGMEFGKNCPKDFKKFYFSDVEFKHGGNDKNIIVPEFELKKGEIIGIIGESGQGKSTFLSLLADFIKPDKGQREVDNQSYDQLSIQFFGKNIAFISQEVELFNLNLLENITLGKKVSEKALFKYFKELGLSDWFASLHRGWETVVGEKGLRLSAGQKQRVNLLRGLILDRPIIILDEPTSHLDMETEQRVIVFLERHLKGKTAVIVTHKKEILALCDRVYEIKKHTLKEV